MSATPETRSPWRVVAEREIATMARSKGFLISLALQLIGLVVLVVVLSLVDGGGDTERVGVVGDDAATAVESASTIADQIAAGTHLVPTPYDDAAAAERAVRDGDLAAALLPAGEGFELVGDSDVDPTLAQAVSTAVAQQVSTANAQQQGVDLGALLAGTRIDQRLLDAPGADDGLRQVTAAVFVVLFYLTALTFGLALATSVVQEKESRVVEILAAAVPIRSLLWGKIAGVSLLAIGQTVALLVVGLVALLATGNTDALSAIGPAAIWYVLFFVLGFVALASVWSVAGSLAGRQQDLGTTTTPLQLLLFAPYIIGISAGEGVRTVVSMLPIVSTMLMPSRLAQGDVPLWQLGVAIAVTVLSAVVLVRVGAGIYERTLLRTGGRVRLKEALQTQP